MIDQNILIIGMGKTGISSYDALKDKYHLLCFDDINKEKLKNQYCFVDNIKDIDWAKINKILVSPGIGLAHPVVSAAIAYGVELTCDLDLFYESVCGANIIGITGTNGKSTTTNLIYHIIKAANLDCAIGGNIGIPVLSLPKVKDNYVIELSSFGLELKNKFTPNIAVILNITPDHLDRHISLENYIEAKLKILQNLKSHLILSLDSPINEKIYDFLKNLPKDYKIITISSNRPADIRAQQGLIFDNVFQLNKINYEDNKYLQGSHNCENIAASYAVAKIVGIEQKTILQAIQTYVGLKHRMQYLGQINNISFYNDSKATNVVAASKAITTLKNIYWLAGGIAKEGGIDYMVILLSNIRRAYLFGQDKLLFARALKQANIDFVISDNLSDAFELAFGDASSALDLSNILLSPACASYDQYKNFEERGEHFIELFNRKVYESKT